MKTRIIVILQFFACIVFANNSSSQFSITPFPLTNQLPSNSVQRIFQDKDGFIWLGTLDGICRYDGYRLLTFRSDVNNPKLLTNNEITSICEDTQGYLWIGTKKGLNILDKKTYQIKQLDLPEVRDVEIRTITVSSDGNIWVGTYRQVIRFNHDHSIRKKYDGSIPVSSVNTIYEDNDKNIWVTLWNNGLFLYDKENDVFTKLPNIGESNNPFKILHDKDNNIWIATWGDGIFLLNKKNGEYSYRRPYITNLGSSINESRFFSIEQDDVHGYLWLVSISGLHAFKVIENSALQKIDISSLMKRTNNIFSEVVKDQKGNLWISTFSEQVFTINFEKPIIQNHLMTSIKTRTGITPNVTSIYEDNNETIWFNQNRYGLATMDTKSNEIQLYKDVPSTKNLRGLDVVGCVAGFRSIPNEVWVASEFSLIYSLKKNKNSIDLLRTINLEEISPSCGRVNLFFEDRKDNIWIICSYKNFIKFYNKKEIEPIDLPITSITGITEDTKGSIWISTSTNGLYKIIMSGNSKSDFQIQNYNTNNSKLISNNIEAIHGDISGNVWIGTQEGNILAYDVLKQDFFDYTHSFNKINEGILNIVADNYGHIWVSTNKRIVEYNPENKGSREYTSSDGLRVNSFLKNSSFKNNAGKIFFGGNNGIAVFNPSSKLSKEAQPIKVFITDVKVENKSVFSDNNNRHFNTQNQTISFEPNDKNIEIDFSSLEYVYPNKVQYAYRMEGIDDDWVYAKEDRQFAIYNRLKKGTHTFMLKATDENGLWSPETTQFKIYKRPAFYETSWAYFFYFALFFVLIYFTFKIVRNRINLRNELKIAQIEKEKSEELTQSKLRYFTNISHDFMTPLTIVSCLIDDAEIAYKDKITQFDAMRSNIQRLRRLLQQVLDFRKVESGNMKLKLSYGDIVTFIRDICNTHFEPLMQSKNIKFSFVTNQNHIQAFFDSDKVDKVIFNLLSNAYKYTPENGEVKVELEVSDDNRKLLIRVSDTGIGISKKEQQNIFTRFYTDWGGRTKDSNGIGLSLTKDLLELHHGTIQVESDLNQGTTFTIEMPIDKDSYSIIEIENTNQLEEKKSQTNLDISQQATAETKDKQKNEKPENEEINLLLVEDNEELLEVIDSILSRHYNVFTATNGIEALNIVKENTIDIIVSDVMMPEMDGLELARTLKKELETSHIPILLLTAKNSAEDRVECYNAGADGYISKPFELKVLEARVNNFIAHKKNKQKEFKSNVDINISTLEYATFDELFLDNAIKIIEDNLSESDLDVNTYADKLNMSKSSLYRKIKAMTGLSPNEFIRNIRLKHACQMLKKQSASISEVAYAVGFSDPKYFTLCFKNEFNMTPREYQKSIPPKNKDFEEEG